MSLPLQKHSLMAYDFYFERLQRLQKPSLLNSSLSQYRTTCFRSALASYNF